ncbi:MAG: Pterin 4 alpha carbinolamine dehydratase [Candidatus Parcubacteria bacterium]|jgi:pterin-4a-carbinolamine dehydratase
MAKVTITNKTAPRKTTAKKVVAPKVPPKRLKSLGSHWVHNTKRQELVGEFAFTRYLDAFMFATRITVYAEVQKHYPEICITPELVKVTLQTKDIKAVTEADLLMAERINRIIMSRA